MNKISVTNIHLHKQSKILELHFDNGSQYSLTCEYLRTHSPSAEVSGHGGVGGELPLDKQDVNIDKIEPVGHYAIKLFFDDGHDSGLYSWETLYNLSINFEKNWQTYLAKAKQKKAHQLGRNVGDIIDIKIKH